MTMELELKHVAVDDLIGKDAETLKEIATECETLKAAVHAELKRQATTALEALKAAGGSFDVSEKPAQKKRGPKPKSQAPEVNGFDVEDLDDADLQADA
jgi:hypothetical protein